MRNIKGYRSTSSKKQITSKQKRLPVLDSALLKPALTIKSLSVILDASQITHDARLAFSQLCQAQQLARHLSCPYLTKAIHAMVTSRLQQLNVHKATLDTDLESPADTKFGHVGPSGDPSQGTYKTSFE